MPLVSWHWLSFPEGVSPHHQPFMSAGPKVPGIMVSMDQKDTVDIRFIGKEASGIHDTSRICASVVTTMSQGIGERIFL